MGLSTETKYRWLNQDAADLIAAILSLRNKNEAARFLRDLMTVAEIKEFSNRWKAARWLAQGQTYVKIVNKTGLSSTTVARIQKWLAGRLGGYRLIIKRISHHHTGSSWKRLMA